MIIIKEYWGLYSMQMKWDTHNKYLCLMSTTNVCPQYRLQISDNNRAEAILRNPVKQFGESESNIWILCS